MNVSEWQKRLEDNFSSNGVIGEKLMSIIEQENDFGLQMLNYQGHRILNDSFQSFFIETLEQTDQWLGRNGVSAGAPTYLFILLQYVSMFKRLRAAENLFLHGYPLDGFSLLRDIKDQAIFLAAIITGQTSLSALNGVEPFGKVLLNEKEKEKLHSKKLIEEKRVMKLYVGADSGLAREIIDDLTDWERAFHAEVHGSRFTKTEALKWLQGEEELHFAPNPKEQSVAMYMNRATEINWMVLRTFPYLQLEHNAFGGEWARKWKVLDESYEYAVLGLEKLGKRIATSFLAFVKVKFLFSPQDTFYTDRG